MEVETGRELLDAEIRRYVSGRWRVVSRTPTAAQLVKPRRFSVLWWLFWTLVTLGPGIALYPLWWLLFAKDKGLYLEVMPDGTLARR
jgi:hypothetical protein